MYKWTLAFIVTCIVVLLGANSLLTASESKKFSDESVLVNRLSKGDMWTVSTSPCPNTPEKSLDIYNKATAQAKTENVFNTKEEIALFAKAFVEVIKRPFTDEGETELVAVEFNRQDGSLAMVLVLGFRGSCWLGSFRLTPEAWVAMKENMRGI